MNNWLTWNKPRKGVGVDPLQKDFTYFKKVCHTCFVFIRQRLFQYYMELNSTLKARHVLIIKKDGKFAAC